MSGGHLSKEFFELVKSIGESRSKQEEDKIIVGEIAILKQHLNQPNISAKKMKEYMIRAVYAEMLGHDASFAYIHAVKLTHEKNLMAKRIGYLTCNLFLNKDHELMLLLINTMQRDLQSANHLETCAALTSVCRLVNLEMIPAISPAVFNLLSHSQESVRKKAVVAVHRFYKLVPETVIEKRDMIRKILCDPDPSVMGASLHILFEIAKSSPASCKDLVSSFVSILKQITEHRLPRDFDYHRMPAPWLQVKLLSILGLLGVADQKASEEMYEILQECMRRADSGVNVGYAIIYECVKCITRIYPHHDLLELAATNISRFIQSDNHNLKYLGVTGLAQIVQVNASYATEHQMVVVDCLEDPDDTLKRKTLDLLYRMTNPKNIEVVVDKLTFHLRTSVDAHLRRELVQRVTSLAENYAPNNEWYVNTMNTVFELGGDLVPPETAYNLMNLVAEGTGEDDAADQAFRTYAVNLYLKLLEKPSLPDILVQVIAWVLGEYARLASVDGYTLDDILDLLCDVVERQFEDAATRGYIVNAVMKLVGQHSLNSATVDGIISHYRSSRLTDLQQRCYEFDQLRKTPSLMQRVLPYDASCEDIVVNKELPFLDSFVQKKIGEGAKPYQTATQRAAKTASLNGVFQSDSEPKPGLNFTPYQTPARPQAGAPQASAQRESISNNDFASNDTSAFSNDASKNAGLNVSGPRKWGPAGYNQPGGEKTERQAESSSHRSTTPAETPSYNQPSKPSFGGAPAKQESGVMSEKQRMAAALFSGLDGSKSSATPTSASPAPAATRPPVAEKKAAAPPPPPPPAKSDAGMMDLLDLDDGFGTTAAPQTPANPAPSPSTDNDMLLLDMGSASAPAPPPPPQSFQPAPAFNQQTLQNVQPSAILAPLQVTISQIGGMWGQLPAERRVQVQTSLLNCKDMMVRLQNALNVYPVEVRGVEGIAAGRVLPGNDPCFLHGKLDPPRVEVMIRSKDPGVSQRVAELCTRALT